MVHGSGYKIDQIVKDLEKTKHAQPAWKLRLRISELYEETENDEKPLFWIPETCEDTGTLVTCAETERRTRAGGLSGGPLGQHEAPREAALLQLLAVHDLGRRRGEDELLPRRCSPILKPIKR